MATTIKDIRSWLKEGKKRKATHMLVVCDTFDYSDYPVYVQKEENVNEVIGKTCRPDNMQTLMEVYNMSMDIDEQLNQKRSFNY